MRMVLGSNTSPKRERGRGNEGLAPGAPSLALRASVGPDVRASGSVSHTGIRVRFSLLRMMAIVGLVATVFAGLHLATMPNPEPIDIVLLAAVAAPTFGGYACAIGVRKMRPWWEGFLVGAFAGPVGLVVEWLMPDRRLDSTRRWWERVLLFCIYGPIVWPIVRLLLDRKPRHEPKPLTASCGQTSS